MELNRAFQALLDQVELTFLVTGEGRLLKNRPRQLVLFSSSTVSYAKYSIATVVEEAGEPLVRSCG